MIRLFLAELQRSWIVFTRYPSEAVTGIVTLTAIFLALILGVQSVVGGGVGTSQFGNNLNALIVTYILWSMSLFALGDMAWTIQNEAQTGTLEQLYLSPYGPKVVFLLRAIADLFVQIAMIAVVLAFILVITRRTLHFSLSVIPLVITILLGTYGLGFMLAGMTLLFKRIQNLIQLSQFVVLFLVAVPVEKWQPPVQWLGDLIPLAPGAGLLRQIMAPAPLGAPAFDLPQFCYALGNGILYFALGLFLFRQADRTAKAKGLLGGY